MDDRRKWTFEPENAESNIFKDNYMAISNTLNECIGDFLSEDHSSERSEQMHVTRALTDAKEKEEEQVYCRFADALMANLVHGVRVSSLSILFPTFSSSNSLFLSLLI